MRGLAVLAAVLGMVAAPLCAAEPGDIYSKGGVTGPGFVRSAKCAAIYVVTAQMVGEQGDGYAAAVRQGTEMAPAITATPAARADASIAPMPATKARASARSQ